MMFVPHFCHTFTNVLGGQFDGVIVAALSRAGRNNV
jgi:hypothetical protein